MNEATLLLITKYCAEFLVDEKLAKSICFVESSWETYRTRYENLWHYFYYPHICSNKLLISLETEKSHQMTSWGLMQVMGSVARELGFDDYMPKLCLPEHGLFYGIKKLSLLKRKYPLISDVIASYNAGRPAHSPDGRYVNQNYVDKVTAALKTF